MPGKLSEIAYNWSSAIQLALIVFWTGKSPVSIEPHPIMCPQGSPAILNRSLTMRKWRPPMFPGEVRTANYRYTPGHTGSLRSHWQLLADSKESSQSDATSTKVTATQAVPRSAVVAERGTRETAVTGFENKPSRIAVAYSGES